MKVGVAKRSVKHVSSKKDTTPLLPELKTIFEITERDVLKMPQDIVKDIPDFKPLSYFNFSWINPKDDNGKLIGGMRFLESKNDEDKAFFKYLVTNLNVGLIVSLTSGKGYDQPPIAPEKFNDGNVKTISSSGPTDKTIQEYTLNSGKDQKNFSVLFLPIQDFGVPSIEQVNAFVTKVDEFHKQNKNVVVHCGAGLGRTGTMLACWYANKHKDKLTIKDTQLTADGVIKAIRLARDPQSKVNGHISIETDEQKEFVKKYIESLKPPAVAMGKSGEAVLSAC
jgi:protein-tyrosine phosphatase